MPNPIINKLHAYLSEELPHLEPERDSKPIFKKNPDEETARRKAALTIKSAWRRHKFEKAFFKDTYAAYIEMQDDDARDKWLSEMMFGRTIAAHKAKAPKFVPKNPHVNLKALYFRTDPTFPIRDLTETLKSYEKKPDQKHFNYIPVTLSTMIPVEDVINEYAAEYKDSIKILKKEGNPLAFIKVNKNDERFFLLKKILSTLGLIPLNFVGKSAGLGVKASLWQITRNIQTKPESVINKKNDTNFDRVKEFLPSDLSSLQRDYLGPLTSIANSKQNPNHHLAFCMINLLNGIPSDTKISTAAIQRIALMVNLAATVYKSDYDRFSFFMYCVIHEITLLLEKNAFNVSYQDFKNETIINAISEFGLPQATADTKYQYVVLPASSGTNAMTLALNLAKEAFKGQNPTVKQESEIYFEFKNLRLEKVSQKNSTSDIYLITSGPTVWTGIYPGTDVNKAIRAIIEKNGNNELRPTTIVIDATSGLHRNLKIEEDLKEYITSGKISLLVHESHQKFGLVHSDQAQYGKVFGICSTEKFLPTIKEFEEKAQVDLAGNLDMQIGSYISNCAGKVLEEIKEAHFRNGKYLRDMFSHVGLNLIGILPDKYSITDAERGLFVYGTRISSIGKIIAKHLEFRGSFGHFNTTWADVGPYYRISPSASDKVDILIEGTEISLAASLKKKELFSTLKEIVINEFRVGTDFSLDEQVLFAGLLQTLKNVNYKPQSERDKFILQYALTTMLKKCDKLSGRKCLHELIEYSKQENFKPENYDFFFTSIPNSDDDGVIRKLADSLHTEDRKLFLTSALRYSIGASVNNLSEISWYIENGADVAPALRNINNQTPLKVIQLLVGKLDGFTLDPEKIPIHRFTDPEVRTYLKKVEAVLKLRDACQNYSAYLEKICKSTTVSPVKTIISQKKLNQVKSLYKTLNFADLDASLNAFKEKFNRADQILNLFKDDSGKKFKRVIFAIFTGGMYVAYRAARLGSIQFWKSRREILVDKANKAVPGLKPPQRPTRK